MMCIVLVVSISRSNSALAARCYFAASGPLLAECHLSVFPSEFIVMLVKAEWRRGSFWTIAIYCVVCAVVLVVLCIAGGLSSCTVDSLYC